MDRNDITALLSQVARKDRAAFDQLFHATSAKLFGVALRILKDRQQAEEATQEVYLKVWQKAESFDPAQGSPMSWLIAMTRNRVIDRLRAQRMQTQSFDESPEIADGQPTPESQSAANQDRRRIDLCLETLEQDKAKAIRAAYLEGHSYADIAQSLKVPLNTIRTWLRRSLLALKTCLEGSDDA